MCDIVEVFDSLVYAFGGCSALEFAASCIADYGSKLFWGWVVGFLDEQRDS